LAGESPEGVAHPSFADRRKAGSIADAAHPKRIMIGGRPSIVSGEFQLYFLGDSPIGSGTVPVNRQRGAGNMAGRCRQRGAGNRQG
jgi:hypothetical protein